MEQGVTAEKAIALEGPTDDPGKRRRLAQGLPVVPAFDGFRAYAVLGVLAVHILIVSGFLPYNNGNLAGVLAWGTIGQMLDMLFIISGFVIYLPTVARGGTFGSVRSFGLRRAARLLPAYWAVLLIILVLLAVVPLTPPIAFPSAFEIGLNFTFLEVPAEFFRNTFFLGFGVDRAIWTLWSEVCFYALLPLVAAWFYKRPFHGLAIAAAITAVWKTGFNHLDGISSTLGFHLSSDSAAKLVNAADLQFPSWVFSIALGMTAAWLYVRLRDRVEASALAAWGRWAQLGSLIGLAVFTYLAGNLSTSAPWLTAPEFARHSVVVSLGLSTAFASFMLATALAPLRFQRPFVTPATRWIADYSVGIYLFHLVIITFLAGLSGLPQDGTVGAVLIWSAIAVPLSLLYGWLSGRYLEQPARRWAQRRAKRDRRTRATAVVRAPGG